MAKYSYEFKKKIIKAYLSGEGSYSYLARKYGIPDKHMVNLWINNYKAFGDDALMCSRNIKNILSKRILLLQNYTYQMRFHIGTWQFKNT